MKKMRIILGFWTVIFLSMHYHYFTMMSNYSVIHPVLILKQALISILSISSLAILISTLFRIDVNLDGQLCYNPKNIYWKTLSAFADIGPQIKLCKMYWITAFIVTITYLAILIICVFIWILKLIVVSLFTWSLSPELFNLLFITVVAMIVVSFVFLFIYIQKKYKSKSMTILLSFLTVIFFGFGIYVIFKTFLIPSFFFLYELFTSPNIIVMIGSILFFSMIVSYLLIKLALKFIPELKNTILGRIYYSGEAGLCPTVYACEYAKKE